MCLLLSYFQVVSHIFFKDFIYLFDKEGERDYKQAEREKQASHPAGSPMWGSIPGPWDHDLSRRQTLNS